MPNSLSLSCSRLFPRGKRDRGLFPLIGAHSPHGPPSPLDQGQLKAQADLLGGFFGSLPCFSSASRGRASIEPLFLLIAPLLTPDQFVFRPPDGRKYPPSFCVSYQYYRSHGQHKRRFPLSPSKSPCVLDSLPLLRYGNRRRVCPRATSDSRASPSPSLGLTDRFRTVAESFFFPQDRPLVQCTPPFSPFFFLFVATTEPGKNTCDRSSFFFPFY